MNATADKNNQTTDETRRTGACSLQQTRQKALQQYINEDDIVTDFYNMLYAVTPYLLETCFSSPSKFCLIKFLVTVLRMSLLKLKHL